MTGRQLRNWMRRNNYTVAAFARDLGVGERIVYRWRGGDSKVPKHVDLACEALAAQRD